MMVSLDTDAMTDVLRRDLILERSRASTLRDEVIRIKNQRDRIIDVLTDGLGADPAAHWQAADIDAAHMIRIAELIREEGL